MREVCLWDHEDLRGGIILEGNCLIELFLLACEEFENSKLE